MNSENFAELAAEACYDRKAIDTKLIRVDRVSSIADWLVITSGLSNVQVRAIAKSVEEKIEKETGILPLRKEGYNEGSWILLDYGEIIVHILMPDKRAYYDLEAFWDHGESKFFVNSEED